MENGPRKILLLVEEPTLAEITAFRLELMGYRVETALSVEEALAAADRLQPDLLVVDLAAAEPASMDLMGRLAQDARTKEIPVLALSGQADLDCVQRAFRAGVRDYLVTPYDPQVLEQKLCKLLPVPE
jgi:CheY-like chemotaxis protein